MFIATILIILIIIIFHSVFIIKSYFFLLSRKGRDFKESTAIFDVKKTCRVVLIIFPQNINIINDNNNNILDVFRRIRSSIDP